MEDEEKLMKLPIIRAKFIDCKACNKIHTLYKLGTDYLEEDEVMERMKTGKFLLHTQWVEN